jgi:polysaccharide export outer membrane protein
MPARLLLLLTALACCVATARAQPTDSAPAGKSNDPAYRLSPGDTILVNVYNEPDLTSTQTLGREGEVRLVLIGEMTVGGKNIREAERLLETAYRDRQFLKQPAVAITVTAYNPREVSVLGAVRSPGTVVFPRDSTSLDIVEVITRVGGFLPVSKSEAVTITHRQPDGTETTVIVNLENIMTGRRQAGRERANVSVHPGDRVWVPERLF